MQMVRMRRELAALRKQQLQLRPATSEEETAEEDPESREDKAQGDEGNTDLTPTTEPDEDIGERQSLQLEARGLRHELSKWQHQCTVFEAEGPRQDAEIAQLKAELQHANDVLESTKNALRHQRVEGLQPPPADKSGATKAGGQVSVPLHAGGHSSIEANAERLVREKAQARNEALTEKARRLTDVTRHQQIAIQRLERDLMKESSELEQREVKIAAASRRQLHLKGALRRCSDDMVAMALGMAPQAAGVPPDVDWPPQRAASQPPLALPPIASAS